MPPASGEQDASKAATLIGYLCRVLRIVLDDKSCAPGSEVAGHVSVESNHERVRGLTVELARRDSSSRSRTTGFKVMAKARLDAHGSEPAPFRLTVPQSALPGFTGRYGKVEWLVRASADVAGIDPTETAIFEVTAPTEPTVVSAQRQVPADLRDRAARPSRYDGQMIDTVVLLALLGFGFWMVGQGLSDYFNDEGGNGALGFSLVGIGFIAFMAWMLLERYPLKTRGVTVEPSATVLSRGQTVRASVTVTRPGMVVGLKGVERYAVDRRSEHGRNVVYPEQVFHEEWRQIERGETEVEFAIPADVLVSYEGRAIIIDWYLAVIRDKHRTRKVPVSQHRTRLLVVY